MSNHPVHAHRLLTAEAHFQSIVRAIGYMKTNLGEPTNLVKLSSVAAMSKFHFIRIFEELTGTTPYHFLTSLRIQRAKDLLLRSSDSVTDICFDVGYSSLGTFSRIFHSQVGIAPSAFREMVATCDLLQMENAVKMFTELQQQAVPAQAIRGVIHANDAPGGFIFIGAFSRGIPQGVPDSGTVLFAPGAFRLPRPQSALFRLLAILVPFTANPLNVLAGDFPTRLLASHRCNGLDEEFHLTLRESLPTDPPIIVALPVLLESSLAGSRRAALSAEANLMPI